MKTGVDGIFYLTMHLQHTHVRRKDTLSLFILFRYTPVVLRSAAVRIHFLSIHFISVYTHSTHMFPDNTLSECLFYIGIHTPGIHTCPLHQKT